ncbi:TPA: hypothetical protein NV821_004388 [Escherichia coli]|nr:hypothetical protein [Escherichia coli]
MKKLLLLLIFLSSPVFAIDSTYTDKINQSFVDYMQKHYRSQGMSESEINKKSVGTLKQFQNMTSSSALAKNLLFKGIKTPLGFIFRFQPLIMAGVTLYEACEELCDYFGTSQKPNQEVSHENPVLITPSKGQQYTTNPCETSKVVIREADKENGITELKGWATIPCYKPKGSIGRDQYITVAPDPVLQEWIGTGVSQEVANQNFVYNGKVFESMPLYYYTRASNLQQGILPGYGPLVIGGLDDIFANDPALIDQKIDSKDAAKGLLSFYQSNWVPSDDSFNLKDPGNPLAPGRPFPDVKLPSTTTTPQDLLKPSVGTTTPAPVTPSLPEVSTDGDGNYTNVEFPGYEFDDVPNDNVLLVLYNTVDEFIKEHSWNLVKTGVCPVIDLNVADVRIHAEKHCDIFEYLRPIIASIMMMLGGITSIMIILRA